MVTLFRLGSDCQREKWFIEVLGHSMRSISDPCKSDRSVARSHTTKKSEIEKLPRDLFGLVSATRDL